MRNRHPLHPRFVRASLGTRRGRRENTKTPQGGVLKPRPRSRYANQRIRILVSYFSAEKKAKEAVKEAKEGLKQAEEAFKDAEDNSGIEQAEKAAREAEKAYSEAHRVREYVASAATAGEIQLARKYA